MVGIHCLLSSKLLDGKSQVYIRATITRTYRPMLKTEIYVNPRFFKRGTIVENLVGRVNEQLRQEAREAKYKLEVYIKYLESLVHEFPDKVLDKEWLKRQMLKCRRSLDLISVGEVTTGLSEVQHIIESGKADKPIYDYIDEYITFRNVSNYRIEDYTNIKRRLVRYEMFEYYMGNDAFSLNLSDFNSDVLNSFQQFCLHQGDLAKSYPRIFDSINKSVLEKVPYLNPSAKPQITNISQNTCISMMKDLKSFVKWLRTKSLIVDDPFAHFTIKEPTYSARPVFISIEERKKLASLDLRDAHSLEIQRDIFIFHCLVGCRYGDLVTLTEDNVLEEKFLQYVPNKTRKSVNNVTPKVPLTEEAKALIDKYRGKDVKGRLFPFASNTYYNNCLKEIFTIAGLTRTVQVLNPQTRLPQSIPLNEFVSSHLARRTFIGNLYNKIKDPGIISVMSGHVEHSRAFSRYRDIGDDVRRDLIEKIK